MLLIIEIAAHPAIATGSLSDTEIGSRHAPAACGRHGGDCRLLHGGRDRGLRPSNLRSKHCMSHGVTPRLLMLSRHHTHHDSAESSSQEGKASTL